MLPLAWMIGKGIHVNIFSKENPLGQLGFLYTLNQLNYLLIVMWIFSTVPIVIPIISLILGTTLNSCIFVAVATCIIEVIFAITLFLELNKMKIDK
jgi:hypothetical protein